MLSDLRGLLQLGGAVLEAGLGKAKDTVTTAAAMGNPELLTSVVRTEIEQMVGRMGFVREDELAALRRHVERLEAELQEARQQAPAPKPAKKAAPAASVDTPVKKRKRPVTDASA